MKKILLALAVFILSGKLSADTIIVSSISSLQNAIDNAKSGDSILLTDGVYSTTGNLIVNRTGTSSEPITIAAKDPGKAEVTGAGGFDLVSPASYIIIKGFKFTHASSRAKTEPGTTHCRFTENVFETTGNGEDLTIAGNYHEIDHNTFQNKDAMGRFLAIRGAGNQIAEHLWIHHNYFKNFKSQGGKNGAEAFQFGLSGFSLSSSNSIVEYNLFENCAGENELVSVKASAVTLCYNTIRNCPAQFTLRHGNKSLVYANYFINTPGLRIFGDDHLIYSNYFENCKPAITVGNGDGEVADGAKLTSHDRPDRVLIAFNTLVNNAVNITMTFRENGLGTTLINVADNIIMGGGAAAIISGPYLQGSWTGNIIYRTNGAGYMPQTGYTMADPKLEKNDEGIFHLQKKSRAVNAAVGIYPLVDVDMDGQKRARPFDIGADEVSTSKVTARPLYPADVGAKQ